MRRRPLLLALLPGLLAVAGCDDAFDPRADGPPYFAVFGVLDGQRETQVFRVEDVRVPLDSAAPSLAARVALEDQTTGVEVVGRDSTLQLSDGTRGHAVLLPLAVRSGHTYRLTLERLDDPTARTTVTVPVEEAPPATPSPPIETNGTYTQNLFVPYRRLPSPAFVAAYRVADTGTGQEHAFEFPVVLRLLSDGVGVTVSLSANVVAIRRALGVDPADTEALALRQVALRFIQTAAEAGTFQDGLGEVGWRVRAAAPWGLDPHVVRALGLVDAQEGDATAALREARGSASR